MDLLVNFAVKRVGSAIGAMPFNSQTSSCDVFNKNGQACCTNMKEAKKNNMVYCGPQQPITQQRTRRGVILARKHK